MATKGKTTKTAAKKTTKTTAKKTTTRKATPKKATTTRAKKKKTVSFEDIQVRAYEIYLQNGDWSSPEQNWLQAEKELVG